MFKLSIFVFMLLLTCSIGSVIEVGKIDSCGLNDVDRAYMNANAKAVKILHNKFPIKCQGSGVRDNHGIEMLALTFRVENEVNISYARKLIIEVMKEYLSLLNEDSQLRPFLAKYPFDENNVDITLIFFQKDGDFAYHPNIRIANAIKGNIYYHTKNESNPFVYKDSYTETYEKASEKVQSESGD